MILFFINLLLITLFVISFGQIDRKCLNCICKIESDCQPLECRWVINSNLCGYYQLKSTYWMNCGLPGHSFEDCSKNKTCAEQCVQSYMIKYAIRCTGGRILTCRDYSRLHNGGPNGCQTILTESYWNKIVACYNFG